MAWFLQTSENQTERPIAYATREEAWDQAMFAAAYAAELRAKYSYDMEGISKADRGRAVLHFDLDSDSITIDLFGKGKMRVRIYEGPFAVCDGKAKE